MREVTVAAREWRFFVGLVLQALVVFALALCASGARAQASAALASNVAVCGPTGLSGVAYASVGGHPVLCGTDANGNALVLQVSQQFVAVNVSDTTDDDGATVGMAIGGSVLGVLAVAFGFRVLRNFVSSSSEG
jgi:hypothetical protein